MNNRTLTTAALLLLALAAMPAPAQAITADGTGHTINIDVCPDGQRLRIVGFITDADTANLLSLGVPQCEDAEGEQSCMENWWQDKCDTNNCDFDDTQSAAYCREVYCTHNPEAYTCREQSRCSDGFYDRDTDHDGYCDRDDNDDDGDDVPDDEDAVPYANDPVNNAISCALYIPESNNLNCLSHIV